MRGLIALGLLIVIGCRQPAIQDAKGSLHLSPAIVDFGVLHPGQSRWLKVQLRNDGPLAQIEWARPTTAFVLTEDLPTEAPTGEVEFTVQFAPTMVGTFKETLNVRADGAGNSSTSLVGEARGVPMCPNPSDCNDVSFDLETNKCVERARADGVSCGGSNLCLIAATCVAARCVGAPKNCGDDNACTIDTCNSVTGCEHLPAPPCPGDGKCQVGVCDKATGCGFERADDGTVCGPLQTCSAAEVCIAGSCVVRDPPDGYVCAEASPCQSEGRCVENLCARGPATPLVPSWTYDAVTADAGIGKKPPLVHDLLVEPNGAVTLNGAFASIPQLRRNTSKAVEPAMGVAGRCLLWNGKMICSKPNDSLNAVDLSMGGTLWSFNLRTARPSIKVNNLFVARMAVQSSDRLATLWEAYPDAPNCRIYYLAILDAAGGLVLATELSDPSFSVCNHPHAYGFGADSAGQLFVAFAPTVKNPPLISGSPTLVMSYSRDGVFRWKYSDVGLKGGEIALARGLLYSENSSTAVLTSTGQPAFTLAEKFGRATVTRNRLVLAPLVGANHLNGFESGTGTSRWTHSLPAGQTFASDQIRLASWSTRRGAQTVALTFTQENGKTQLHGILARDGSEAFTCEVTQVSRTPPQLFEVAEGSLSVMDGATGCGTCEPAYADKSAAFHTLTVPGLTPANEAWVGTWGGPGRDHQEE